VLAKKPLMEREMKMMDLYKTQHADQPTNEKDKKFLVIKNELKKKELEQKLILAGEPVHGKCAMHNYLQQVINFPSIVNSEDMLEVLKHHNLGHIQSYQNLQYLPSMVRRKRIEAKDKQKMLEAQRREEERLRQIEIDRIK